MPNPETETKEQILARLRAIPPEELAEKYPAGRDLDVWIAQVVLQAEVTRTGDGQWELRTREGKMPIPLPEFSLSRWGADQLVHNLKTQYPDLKTRQTVEDGAGGKTRHIFEVEAGGKKFVGSADTVPLATSRAFIKSKYSIQ